MKDAELRGLMLYKFYDARRHGVIQMPTDDVFDGDTAFDICRQLSEHGLLNWKPLQALSGFRSGLGQITADGVDVVEGTKLPPISIKFNQSVAVSNSPGAQVAHAQGRNSKMSVRDISLAIERESVGERDKSEAKSLWDQVAENPIIRKILENVLS